MNATVTVDRAGRIVLPKSIREALRVGPGDTLEIATEDDHMVVSPVRAEPALLKEQGVWVYRSGATCDVPLPSLIDERRNERADELTGRKP